MANEQTPSAEDYEKARIIVRDHFHSNTYEFIGVIAQMRAAARAEGAREELELRKLLWLRHGCSGLYGDDGEMQCSACLIDFKRMSAREIGDRWRTINAIKAGYLPDSSARSTESAPAAAKEWRFRAGDKCAACDKRAVMACLPCEEALCEEHAAKFPHKDCAPGSRARGTP